MYDRQLDAIFHADRYGIVEASSKSGKTVGCMVWLAEQALQGKPERNFWWVAPVYSQAKIAYRRLKAGVPHQLYTPNETELTLSLPNRTRIWFKGADKPDSLYGEDVFAAVIDEASRVKEDSWHAVRSTLTATRGPVRIIGNVKGRRNWFYQLARRAETGEPDMAYHRITWQDAVAAGILDVAEVEDARRVLPESVFNELYACEPSDDAGNPFGLQAIRDCIAPLSVDEPAVWAWDLAKSLDFTAGVALDRSGAVCRFTRFQQPWTETIQTIRRESGHTPTLVDSTGVGDPILEALQREGGNYEGFKFTAPSKQQLMEGLAVAIQQREIRFPAGPIAAELEAFEYQYTRTGVHYAAPEGMHDDCVCALALAVAHWRQARPPAFGGTAAPDMFVPQGIQRGRLWTGRLG